MEHDGFQQVLHQRRRRHSSKVRDTIKIKDKNLRFKRANVGAAFELQNKFSALSGATADSTPTKLNKLPPFVVDMKGKMFGELRSTLKSAQLKFSPVIVHRQKQNEMVINVSCLEDYRALQSKFEKEETSFYVYKDPEQVLPIKLIIRNLPNDTNPDEIKSELFESGFPVIDVKQLSSTRKTSNSVREKIKIPLFLVTLKNEEKAKEIVKLETLMYIKIKVENYVKPEGPKQCFKCQGFSHVARNCHRKPNCVKCAGPHLTENCKKTTEEKPKCVNCGQSHTANYKGCNTYAEQLKKFTKAVSKTRTAAPAREGVAGSQNYYKSFPQLRVRENVSPLSTKTSKPSPSPKPQKGGIEEILQLNQESAQLVSEIIKGKLTMQQAIVRTAEINQKLLSLAMQYGSFRS